MRQVVKNNRKIQSITKFTMKQSDDDETYSKYFINNNAVKNNNDDDKNSNEFLGNATPNLKKSVKKAKIKRSYMTVLKERSKGRKSSYFSGKMTTNVRKDMIVNNNWLPPRSPYSLIQEDLYHSPWQLLIATIFLTKTHAKKAIPQILKFLERWPTPNKLLKARSDDIREVIRPLGIHNVRCSLIIKFTGEFIEKEWKYPEELHGIGKYGNDSYRIFCLGEWRDVNPDDKKLNLYKNWLMENADRLGI